MDSILDSVKAYLGIQSEDTSFDVDIIMAINAVLYVLNGFGVGTSQVYSIEDNTQTWSDFLGENPVGGVQEYVNLRVKVLFDPSTNNQIMNAIKEQISELEWRILVDSDKRYYENREV